MCKDKYLTALHDLNTKPLKQSEKATAMVNTPNEPLYLQRSNGSNGILQIAGPPALNMLC